MLEVVYVLLFAVAGAMWRRWFGGWPAIADKRWVKILAALALGFVAALPGMPLTAALAVSALIAVYWLPGHKLQEWKLADWRTRYGLVGLYWWAANRWAIDWRLGNAVDGSNALAEFAAGATVYGLLALLAVL